MLESLISPLMPHHCISCGEFGNGLCDYCKYDIEMVPVEKCVVCDGFLQQKVCQRTCKIEGILQLVLGQREGILERLIDDYKFQPARSFAVVLAELLDSHMPVLPSAAEIVPIPTAPPHIRQRGFDHMQNLASEFAKRRRLSVNRVLWRQHNLQQFGATKAKRHEQAQTAFSCTEKLSDATTYIIFDDIVTTGATIVAACERLKEQGAKQIIVLALAKQAIDH